MRHKLVLPIAALCGLVIAILSVIWSSQKPVTPAIPFPPPTSPYAHAIMGAGTIEASTDNIFINPPFSEIAIAVYVKQNDIVKAGAPLFELDTRTFVAERLQAIREREYAIVQYDNAQTQLDLYNSLTDRRAVSQNDYNQVYYGAQAALAAIAVADAKIEVAQSYIDRSIICAPADGEILQLNVHPGESQNANPFNNLSSIVFGPVSPLHLRVDVDEDDAWRFRKGAPATAYVRGNRTISFPLSYVRTDPLIIPKQSLTGSTVERMDTRVLQVIYRFDWDHLPVYPGQVLDIFIEALPANTRYGDAQIFCH